MCCNLANRLDDDDHGDGDHHEAEEDVPGVLDACLSAGELATVHAFDGTRRHDEGQVGQRVEERIGHGGEERQRLGRGGGVELQHGQEDVGSKAAHDGDAVLEVVGAFLLLCVAHMVVDGLEQPLDVLVLLLVELLELARARGLLVQRDGAEAVALPRRVGADLGEFLLGLERMGEVVRIVVGRVLRERLALYVGEVRCMAGMRVVGAIDGPACLDGSARTVGLAHRIPAAASGWGRGEWARVARRVWRVRVRMKRRRFERNGPVQIRLAGHGGAGRCGQATAQHRII